MDNVEVLKFKLVMKRRSFSPDSYWDGEGDGACLPAGRDEAKWLGWVAE